MKKERKRAVRWPLTPKPRYWKEPRERLPPHLTPVHNLVWALSIRFRYSDCGEHHRTQQAK
jgi:hypothetical protein